jgi:hypothetical protein
MSGQAGQVGCDEVIGRGPWGLLEEGEETLAARYPGPFGRALARLGRVFAAGAQGAEGLAPALVLDARRLEADRGQGERGSGKSQRGPESDGTVLVKEQSWFEGVAARKAAREAEEKQ